MKIGAEDKKKVYFLAVLGVGALYGVYNALSGPSVPSYTPAAPPPRSDVSAIEQPAVPVAEPSAPRSRVRGARNEEFHPVLRPKRKEDQVDPFTIDPEIKLYILAKLQEVPAAGSGRNLFQFGAPPAEKPALPGPETIVKVARLIGPPLVGPPPPPVVSTPQPPPPAPFNAKYYGLATSAASGRKRAFFLDGEDIIIKGEGETVKGHFRIIRIGLTSVVVEDTDSKRQQTVQIAEEAQG